MDGKESETEAVFFRKNCIFAAEISLWKAMALGKRQINYA
jgi:hypothetical protein